MNGDKTTATTPTRVRARSDGDIDSSVRGGGGSGGGGIEASISGGGNSAYISGGNNASISGISLHGQLPPPPPSSVLTRQASTPVSPAAVRESVAATVATNTNSAMTVKALTAEWREVFDPFKHGDDDEELKHMLQSGKRRPSSSSFQRQQQQQQQQLLNQRRQQRQQPRAAANTVNAAVSAHPSGGGGGVTRRGEGVAVTFSPRKQSSLQAPPPPPSPLLSPGGMSAAATAAAIASSAVSGGLCGGGGGVVSSSSPTTAETSQSGQNIGRVRRDGEGDDLSRQLLCDSDNPHNDDDDEEDVYGDDRQRRRGGGGSSSSSGSNRCRHRAEALLKEVARDVVEGSRRVVTESLNMASINTNQEALGQGGSTGFVTFTSLAAATAAVKLTLSHKAWCLTTSLAPEPRGLLWQNVMIDNRHAAARKFMASIILNTGALFFATAIASFAVLANPKEAGLIDAQGAQTKYVKWLHLSDQNNNEAVYTVCSYVPAALGLGLLLLVPWIFLFVASTYESYKSKVDVEISIFKRYFSYYMAYIVITSVTFGAIDSLAGLAEGDINSFGDTVASLGRAVPKASGYFITVLTLKIFFGTTWELSRPWALLTKCVERIVVPRQRIGERHLEQASVPDPCRFGWIYPQLLVVVAITFTYQVITPFMAPFGLTYFSLAYVVYKQQALYVYVNEYESGGVFLPLLLGRTLSVLAAAQALLCLYMLLKENLWGTVLLVGAAAGGDYVLPEVLEACLRPFGGHGALRRRRARRPS